MKGLFVSDRILPQGVWCGNNVNRRPGTWAAVIMGDGYVSLRQGFAASFCQDVPRAIRDRMGRSMRVRILSGCARVFVRSVHRDDELLTHMNDVVGDACLP